MSDTMSNDPRRKAEAQRMASEAAAPKSVPPAAPSLGFDPIALAKDAWETAIDKKYANKTFEEVWASFDDLTDAERKGTVLGSFTEEEYKQILLAMMTSVNAFFLHNASEGANERATARRTLVTHEVNVRLGIPESTVGSLDLRYGVLRRDDGSGSTKKRTCFLHPEGCPDEDGAIQGVAVPMNGNLLQSLMEAIQKSRK